MPKLTLTPESPLSGYAGTVGRVHIEEIPAFTLLALAIPMGAQAQFAKAIDSAYSLDVPAVGDSHCTDSTRLMGMAPEQMFLYRPEADIDAANQAAQALGEAAYITDQSDSWVVLRVSGMDARRALARICMLDLDPKVFAQGRVARTVMEHLGTIIVNQGEDFLLMSARSSAVSFLHAVKVSAENILKPF